MGPRTATSTPETSLQSAARNVQGPENGAKIATRSPRAWSLRAGQASGFPEFRAGLSALDGPYHPGHEYAACHVRGIAFVPTDAFIPAVPLSVFAVAPGAGAGGRHGLLGQHLSHHPAGHAAQRTAVLRGAALRHGRAGRNAGVLEATAGPYPAGSDGGHGDRGQHLPGLRAADLGAEDDSGQSVGLHHRAVCADGAAAAVAGHASPAVGHEPGGGDAGLCGTGADGRSPGGRVRHDLRGMGDAGRCGGHCLRDHPDRALRRPGGPGAGDGRSVVRSRTAVVSPDARSGRIGTGIFLGVAGGGHRAGPQQHPHPVGHELGPENGLAHPGHGHLRR